MAYHDRKALSYFLSPTTWKRFRDNVFVAWEHGTDTLPSFLDYLSNIDEAGKIKFTMEIADQEKSLEFLDLTFKCVESKLSVHVFPKPTNSFVFIKRLHVIHVRMPTTYHVELLLDYAEYVTLMRSLNLVLMNISNI